jgi:hypothetical protein
MLEARIDWGIGCFAAGRIDQRDRGPHGRVTSGVWRTVCVRIFRRKQTASGRGSRCPRDDELVRWKAGPLVGLEHAVGKSVLFSHLKVGLHLGRVHIGKRAVLRTGRARNRIQVRPVHLALPAHRIQVALVNEGIVTVAGIVVRRETDFGQRDGIAFRVFAALGNVRALADQLLILEKIIRSAVLLKDHDNVLNLSGRRWGWWRTAAGTATAVEAEESATHGQDQNCKNQDAKLGHFQQSPRGRSSSFRMMFRVITPPRGLTLGQLDKLLPVRPRNGRPSTPPLDADAGIIETRKMKHSSIFPSVRRFGVGIPLDWMVGSAGLEPAASCL